MIIFLSSCLGTQSPPPTHVACSVGIELTSLIGPGVPLNILISSYCDPLAHYLQLTKPSLTSRVAVFIHYSCRRLGMFVGLLACLVWQWDTKGEAG